MFKIWNILTCKKENLFLRSAASRHIITRSFFWCWLIALFWLLKNHLTLNTSSSFSSLCCRDSDHSKSLILWQCHMSGWARRWMTGWHHSRTGPKYELLHHKLEGLLNQMIWSMLVYFCPDLPVAGAVNHFISEVAPICFRAAWLLWPGQKQQHLVGN